MKVKKDIAYCLHYPWNKYIKEQVRETVSQAYHFMFDTKFYPMFYQEDIHCHFITNANGERHLTPPKEYVYLGSYRDGQREPFELPGLVLDPKKHGEILADCMFTDDFSNRQLRRVFLGKL